MQEARPTMRLMKEAMNEYTGTIDHTSLPLK
jgi:hypothetical protein